MKKIIIELLTYGSIKKIFFFHYRWRCDDRYLLNSISKFKILPFFIRDIQDRVFFFNVLFRVTPTLHCLHNIMFSSGTFFFWKILHVFFFSPIIYFLVHHRKWNVKHSQIIIFNLHVQIFYATQKKRKEKRSIRTGHHG